MKRQEWLSIVAIASLVTVIILSPSLGRSRAQDDPTSVQQTLKAIINPRRSMTARVFAAYTATSGAQLTATSDFNQTATVSAETQTPTPSTTLLASAVNNLPIETLDPTNQFQTIIANVDAILTQTNAAQTSIAGTNAIAGTVNSILIKTLGYTLTPSTTASITLTPTATPSGFWTPEATATTGERDIVLTNVSQILTQTNVAQTAIASTANFVGTVNSIIIQTRGYTLTPSPTPSFTSTATATATIPGMPTQTANVATSVSQHYTETVQAQITQTSVAFFQGTAQKRINDNATATTAAIRATVVNGFAPITIASAGQVKQLFATQAQTASIQSVAFSPNGARFASAGLDNTVRLWDARTGDQVQVLNGLTNRLSVAFSGDGTLLAASSQDNSIRLWDAQTGEERAVLKGHTDSVQSVIFSPDSRLIISASADKTVRVWDAKTYAPLQILKHRAAVYSVAISPDGARIASVGADGLIILWETSTGIQINTFHEIQQRVSTLAFSPDGSLLAVGGNISLVELWNVNSGQVTSNLRGQGNGINSIAFSPDGSVLAVGNQDGTIWLWNVTDKAKLAVMKSHTKAVNSVAFSPDGVRLISGSADKTIRVWGIQAGS